MVYKLQKVINGQISKDAIKHYIDNIVLEKGKFTECIIRPYKAEKTYEQLATIRVLCNEMSLTKENQWMGYSSDFWYRYYKIYAYIPLIKLDAIEDQDQELIDLIESAGKIIRQSNSSSLVKVDKWKLIEEFCLFVLNLKSSMDEKITLKSLLLTAMKMFFKQLRSESIKDYNDEYTVQDFIADNSAFSYATAKKHHLMAVIKFILEDAARKGIYLEIKKKNAK